MNNRTRPVPAHSLRHNLIQHRVLAACISGALALAAMPALAQPVSPDQQISSLAQGDAVNAAKVIYSASNDVAILGRVAQLDGWEFRISNPENVPNSPGTILYFSTNDDVINLKKWTHFLADFKGVLIVDSDEVQRSVEDSRTVSLDAPLEYLSPPVWEGETPASKLYGVLSSRMNGFASAIAVDGTALISSLNNKSIMAYSIDESGKINGSSDGREAFDLQRHRINNLQVPSEKTGENFHYVDHSHQASGWRAHWRTKVTLSAQRLISVELYTGSETTTCVVGNFKCGVYPNSAQEIFTVTRNSDGTVRAVGQMTRVAAQLELENAQVTDFGPTSADFAAKLDSSNELYHNFLWSEWLTSWDLQSVFATTLNQISATSRKSSPLWNNSVTRDNSNNTAFIQQLISLKDKSIPTTMWGQSGGWSNAANFNLMLRDYQLRGRGDGRGHCVSSYNAPMMTYQGWNPSIIAEIRVGSNSDVNFTHQIKSRIIYDRTRVNYRHVSRVNCYGTTVDKMAWRNTDANSVHNIVTIVPDDVLRTYATSVFNLRESRIRSLSFQ